MFTICNTLYVEHTVDMKKKINNFSALDKNVRLLTNLKHLARKNLRSTFGKVFHFL